MAETSARSVNNSLFRLVWRVRMETKNNRKKRFRSWTDVWFLLDCIHVRLRVNVFYISYWYFYVYKLCLCCLYTFLTIFNFNFTFLNWSTGKQNMQNQSDSKQLIKYTMHNTISIAQVCVLWHTFRTFPAISNLLCCFWNMKQPINL